jgi:hypothetical protein
MTNTTSPTAAERQIAALTAVIAVLRDHPDVAEYIDIPLRNLGTHVFAAPDVDPRALFAEFIRGMKAKGAKITKDFSETYANVYADFGAVRIGVQAYRNEVCDLVVTGTREVTEEILDPVALAAVPTTTVTRTEDVKEWVCTPLLADTTAVTA